MILATVATVVASQAVITGAFSIIGFATVDAGFLSARTMKIAGGGWVPLLLGGLISCVMLVWEQGTGAETG